MKIDQVFDNQISPSGFTAPTASTGARAGMDLSSGRQPPGASEASRVLRLREGGPEAGRDSDQALGADMSLNDAPPSHTC